MNYPFSDLDLSRRLERAEGNQGAATARLIDTDEIPLWADISARAWTHEMPKLRRRELQAALLEERMRFAFKGGCDLAMMVAAAGSDSQRNAERQGFRIAYTRTKWRLFP